MTARGDRLQPEDSVRTAWRLLEMRPNVAGQLRALQLDALMKRASATLTPEGHRGVLLALSAGEQLSVIPALRPHRDGVLAAEVATFSDHEAPHRALHIWCRDRRCDDAFVGFCVLLFQSLEVSPIGEALAGCYEQFKRLLKESPENSQTALLGAIGELLVLKDLLRQMPSALAAWAGPRGERHDFRLGLVAIEVKATLRSAAKASRVQIADIDQLDAPDGGKLFLHAIRLERVAGGDISLHRLVADIEAHLDAAGVSEFRSSLASTGAVPTFDETAFSVLSRSTYEVTDGFPKLSRSRLKSGRPDPGIGSIAYQLTLDTASPFVVPWELALSMILSGIRDAS